MGLRKGGRYQTGHLVEDQYEPGSRKQVLKNLQGVKSKLQMDKLEAVALKQTEDALVRMETFDKQHRFTAKDICRTHEIWLGNIYEWAGQYRNVQLVKGSFPFANPTFIPQLMAEFERNTLDRHTPCAFSSIDRIIQPLAEVHVELILIHPFREGNGRIARLLSTLMTLQAGLPPLDFRPIQGRLKQAYIAAIHAGMDKNYQPMERVFRRLLQRVER